MSKELIPNYEFVENWSDEQFDEFISLPANIPNKLMSIVRKVYPEINILRCKAAIKYPLLSKFDNAEERWMIRKLMRNKKI